MAKFYNECIDSADWVEEITGYRPCDDVISFEELAKIANDPEKMEDIMTVYLTTGIIH